MKKILTGILSMVLVFSLCATSVLAIEFTDVPAGKWYADSVKFCVEKGYVSGYKDGTFKPNQHITRAEFSVIMNKFCIDKGLITKDAHTTNIHYKDVLSGKWYTQPILNCVEAGVMTGYSSTKFGVNDKLTREQAAVIFAKAMNLNGHHKSYEYYQDDYKISSWAHHSVWMAKAYGFMKGTGNHRFEPTKPVTRAEIATIVNAVSKIETETIRIENSINNAVQATYNYEDLFHEMMYQQGNYDYRMSDIKNLDYKEIDLTDSWTFWYLTRDWANTFWTNDITDSDVQDIAYAMFSHFNGVVPALNQDDFTHKTDVATLIGIENKDGKYHFLFGNRGEFYNEVSKYNKNSDGSLDVVIQGVDGATNKAVELFSVHMIPNKHVHVGAGKFEFYYTIEDVEYIKK